MAKVTHLDKSVFKFLKDLEKNNNRDWFAENKPKYLAANEHFKALAEEINEGMQKQDHLEKMKLYRIYRDVRFSKNKAPYKNSFSGGFARATKALRGGYYLHLQPDGNSMVGGGFWAPNKEDLQRIREEIDIDPAPLRKIINSASFKKHFGELQGQQLKSAPRDFPKDHPDIDLLRYKSFIVTKTFTDKEVQSPGFAKEVLKYFGATRPFFDYMSEVLTTDGNGVSLID
ncbi:MAG TPA: TIGR02453 family protein [Flavobacteriales bacterium]|nr:TIGR02453 family protein [Flavobacteriales bacterium]